MSQNTAAIVSKKRKNVPFACTQQLDAEHLVKDIIDVDDCSVPPLVRSGREYMSDKEIERCCDNMRDRLHKRNARYIASLSEKEMLSMYKLDEEKLQREIFVTTGDICSFKFASLDVSEFLIKR